MADSKRKDILDCCVAMKKIDKLLVEQRGLLDEQIGILNQMEAHARAVLAVNPQHVAANADVVKVQKERDWNRVRIANNLRQASRNRRDLLRATNDLALETLNV